MNMSDEEKVLNSPEKDDQESKVVILPTGTKTTSIEAPNGGLGAWLQVAGAFCLYFNTW